jgi:hypothetical protein
MGRAIGFAYLLEYQNSPIYFYQCSLKDLPIQNKMKIDFSKGDCSAIVNYSTAATSARFQLKEENICKTH